MNKDFERLLRLWKRLDFAKNVNNPTVDIGLKDFEWLLYCTTYMQEDSHEELFETETGYKGYVQSPYYP